MTMREKYKKEIEESKDFDGIPEWIKNLSREEMEKFFAEEEERIAKEYGNTGNR